MGNRETIRRGELIGRYRRRLDVVRELVEAKPAKPDPVNVSLHPLPKSLQTQSIASKDGSGFHKPSKRSLSATSAKHTAVRRTQRIAGGYTAAAINPHVRDVSAFLPAYRIERLQAKARDVMRKLVRAAVDDKLETVAKLSSLLARIQGDIRYVADKAKR